MTTQTQIIPFGEWLPDLPEYSNPGALIAKNVTPQLQSYRSLNSLASFSTALDDVCLGTFWIQGSDGVVYNFAGDTGKLYRLTGGNTWSDVSGASAPFAAENWDFTKFGDRVIATSINDVLQYYDVGVSTVFADLSGSPPQAARIATVRDFVVLGDLSGIGPNWIQWSGFNNSELWTPDLATQSDTRELRGRGGSIQRIVPGEYGVILLEHSIYVMTPAPPPIVFQLNEVERKRGTPAPNSVCWTGSHVYFWGGDNFYRFNGQSAEPISNNKTSKWFQDNADGSAILSMRGAVDRRNNLVIWAFKSSASEAINNMLIIYNWAADKWSYAEVDTQVIDEFVSPGFSLDDLDTLFADIDSESILVDSDAYKGGDINIQAFNSDNMAATFSGTTLTATIDTKEISSPDNHRIFTNSVLPLLESESGGDNVMVSVGTRNRSQDNTVFTTPRNINAINGEVNVRSGARYQRFRVTTSDAFTHAEGVKVQQRVSNGRR